MKQLFFLSILAFVLSACQKNNSTDATATNNGNCNIDSTYSVNAAKVTIANGIWGTVSEMMGNCMPIIGPGSTCTHCPRLRKVRVYAYTLKSQATAASQGGGFYTAFTTPLIQEVTADADGFYQLSLPAGNYTVAIVENNLLYANMGDSNNGINPIQVTTGKQKLNLVMTYRASF